MITLAEVLPIIEKALIVFIGCIAVLIVVEYKNW